MTGWVASVASRWTGARQPGIVLRHDPTVEKCSCGLVLVLGGSARTFARGERFFLPTILLLVGPTFEPLAPPTIFHELDQVETEEWLAHHFDELGVPDQLSVWKAPEWVLEEWKYFGRDWKTKVKLVNPPRTKPDCSLNWPVSPGRIRGHLLFPSPRWPRV